MFNISLNYPISISPLNSSYTSNETKFNEWLAGFIDGDGHFRIDNNKPKLIIELDSQDHSLLLYIQSKIGGNINPTHGNKNAYRYTLFKRPLIIDLVNRVNGNIRNGIRTPQFINICNFLDIPYKSPIPLTRDSGWFTGFFDADGCISCSLSNNRGTIIIQVSNKYESDVQHYAKFFNGKVINAYTVSPSVKWQINKRSDILNMLEYFRECPPLSHKVSRVRLIEEFYTLRDIKAYRVDSPSYPDWLLLVDNWSYKNYIDLYSHCVYLPPYSTSV